MIERAFSLHVKHLLVEPVPKSPHRIKKELITRLHHEKAATRLQHGSDVGEDDFKIGYAVMQAPDDERDVKSIGYFPAWIGQIQQLARRAYSSLVIGTCRSRNIHPSE